MIRSADHRDASLFFLYQEEIDLHAGQKTEDEPLEVAGLMQYCVKHVVVEWKGTLDGGESRSSQAVELCQIIAST